MVNNLKSDSLDLPLNGCIVLDTNTGLLDLRMNGLMNPYLNELRG